jgi:hypothetical protein
VRARTVYLAAICDTASAALQQGAPPEVIMVSIVKLALLSALLSAALVAALEASRPPQSAGQFLIERLEQRAPDKRLRDSSACPDEAWPYRQSCEGAMPRAVRIIGIDRVQGPAAQAAPRAHIAAR